MTQPILLPISKKRTSLPCIIEPIRAPKSLPRFKRDAIQDASLSVNLIDISDVADVSWAKYGDAQPFARPLTIGAKLTVDNVHIWEIVIENGCCVQSNKRKKKKKERKRFTSACRQPLWPYCYFSMFLFLRILRVGHISFGRWTSLSC